MNRNSLSITWFALATCAGMLLVPTSLAQDPPSPTEDQDPPPSPTERSVPSYTATRVERAPVIDGHLNDDVWQLAPPGGPLLDADKNPGQPMTERTEFRVLYDQDHLYLVLNQNYHADGLSLDVQDTALVLKLSGSWRF